MQAGGGKRYEALRADPANARLSDDELLEKVRPMSFLISSFVPKDRGLGCKVDVDSGSVSRLGLYIYGWLACDCSWKPTRV